MKILMDFLNLFGINVNINENRGVLRWLRPPKGWACSALSAPTVIILNFIILNIFITPVKLIYKKYKTLTKKESLIR